MSVLEHRPYHLPSKASHFPTQPVAALIAEHNSHLLPEPPIYTLVIHKPTGQRFAMGRGYNLVPVPPCYATVTPAALSHYQNGILRVSPELAAAGFRAPVECWLGWRADGPDWAYEYADSEFVAFWLY